MGIFDNVSRFFRSLTGQRIQATEGERDGVYLESLLTGQRYTNSIPGLTNSFQTYETQVRRTYKKYNGRDDFGCPQTRAVIDLRTSFISGEGVNVSSGDDGFNEWVERFIDKNQLGGKLLVDATRGGEMAGQSLLVLKSVQGEEGPEVKVGRKPYAMDAQYRPVYQDPTFPDEVVGMEIRQDGRWVKLMDRNFVYVRTGGDDWNSEGPTTRTGVVLTDLENYDRALKDIRRNNHIMARITPAFKVQAQQEAQNLAQQLNESKWEIGKAFIGTADFDYKAPGTGAHQNLLAEMASTLKTIAAGTGVPIHWLGWVDLMSNRSTADTLYELIKNATQVERLAWEKALYDLILRAQEMYIDAGGQGLTYTKDFKVTLPLLDFNSFLDRVRAYNIALGDGIISKADYRNAIPGIDPIKTEKAIEEEKKDAMDEMMNRPMLAPIVDPQDAEDDDEAPGVSSRDSEEKLAQAGRKLGRPVGS
jgi:hypothetical protein